MRRHLAVMLLVCLPVLPVAAQTPAGKPAPPEITVLAGGYELANEGGDRKCLVLLRPASAPGGYAVGFTPQCRVTLPVMANVAAWTTDGTGKTPRIRLRSTTGAVLLDFNEPTDDGNAQARDASKAIFTLKPTVGASIAQRGDSVPVPRAAPAPVVAAPVITAASVPRDAPAMVRAAGGYALIRDKGRETGCTLTLHDGGTTDGKAELAAGCLDRGLTQFNPTSWRIAAGTLWLVGGKGQKLSFEPNRRSGWDKGPGQGEGLVLQPR